MAQDLAALVTSALVEGRTITDYDAGRLLAAAGELLKSSKLSCLHNVDQLTQQAVDACAKRAAEAIQEAGRVEVVCYEAEQAMDANVDKAYAAYSEANKRLAARIAAIPPLPVQIPIHQLADLADLAERYSQIPDATWARMVELARALAPRAATEGE